MEQAALRIQGSGGANLKLREKARAECPHGSCRCCGGDADEGETLTSRTRATTKARGVAWQRRPWFQVSEGETRELSLLEAGRRKAQGVRRMTEPGGLQGAKSLRGTKLLRVLRVAGFRRSFGSAQFPLGARLLKGLNLNATKETTGGVASQQRHRRLDAQCSKRNTGFRGMGEC